MPRFLRLIKEARWYAYPDISWLQPGELQADVLADLGTTRGNLSVFDVSQSIDAERIAIALAARRQSLQALDYIVFDDGILEPLALSATKSGGETPDSGVNAVHYDVQNITAGVLVNLASELAQIDPTGLSRSSVKRKLIKGINEGRLVTSRFFDKRLLEELRKSDPTL